MLFHKTKKASGDAPFGLTDVLTIAFFFIIFFIVFSFLIPKTIRDQHEETIEIETKTNALERTMLSFLQQETDGITNAESIALNAPDFPDLDLTALTKYIQREFPNHCLELTTIYGTDATGVREKSEHRIGCTFTFNKAVSEKIEITLPGMYTPYSQDITINAVMLSG